jgi:N-methylhydantoinase B
MRPDDFDPIDLEVLRSRLETIGEQACRAVEQTAVSPAVTESKDYSVTLLDADGNLIHGSGAVIFHYGAATHAVRSTIARYGDTIRPGDVFLANDPHNGGGLHPQDVMVQQPIFVGEQRVAWSVVSAHLMDMGGMVVGSFAPDATECFQESFRIPPVRLFRQGREVSEVWDLLATNVRMAELVEMDLRGLVAGAHLAMMRTAEVVTQTGVETFLRSLEVIRNLTETEFRKRIALLADGTYRSTSWTEYGEKFYKIPCNLTVAGDSLTFDFTGASPQCPHFFNSKPYIIAAELVVMIANFLAPDLPFDEGIFGPIQLLCPEGTIVNCQPPAPISAAHMHVALNAAGVGMQALMLALGASPQAPQRQYLGGASWESAIGPQLWSWPLADGGQDAFLVLDGQWAGGSAGAARDGNDHGRNTFGPAVEASYPDIEVLESWFPLLFLDRSTRAGTGGAGAFRAGAGNSFSFRPHGTEAIHGTAFGMRRWLPLQGIAGGRPGACNEFLIHRADGSVEALDVSCSGALVGADDWYEIRVASGGGYGDPLDRDPAAVEADLVAGRFTPDEVGATFGVVAGEPEATMALREALRRDRLQQSVPPAKNLSAIAAPINGDPLPMFPGVVQYGDKAIAAASGAVLARSPDHWTTGCACLIEHLWPKGQGPDVIYRSWLDPLTGRALHVEAVVDGDMDSFLVAPRRWTEAAAVQAAVAV